MACPRGRQAIPCPDKSGLRMACPRGRQAIPCPDKSGMRMACPRGRQAMLESVEICVNLWTKKSE